MNNIEFTINYQMEKAEIRNIIVDKYPDLDEFKIREIAQDIYNKGHDVTYSIDYETLKQL